MKTIRRGLCAIALAALIPIATAQTTDSQGSNAATAPVPQLPVQDFARFPLLSDTVMSPDGKYLAASYEVNQTAGTNARFQLVVFTLPNLKVTARLDFAPWRRPGNIVWVGPQRLVVSENKVPGSLAAAQPTGDIIAMNADGSQQRMLYSIAARGTPGASFNMMDMVNGQPSVVGPTQEMNGHVFIELHPFPMNVSTRNESAHRTILYDVDSISGYPRQVAEIGHGQAQFFMHGDQPIYALGHDRQLQEVVYLPNGNGGWKPAPAGVFGKVFDPLWVTPGGHGVYAQYSAAGGPSELIRCKLDGSDKQVLAGNAYGSVNRILWGPRDHRVPIGVTYTATFKGGVPAVDYLSNDRWVQIHRALMQAFPGKFIDFAGMSTHGNTILLFAFSNNDPGEYALFDGKTMHVQPLMQVMPWLKSGQLATREPVRFKNSQGMELDGFISFPVGVPHKNLPLVLLPHGGPIGIRDRWAYLDDAEQLAAGAGERGGGAGEKIIALEVMLGAIHHDRLPLDERRADGIGAALILGPASPGGERDLGRAATEIRIPRRFEQVAIGIGEQQDAAGILDLAVEIRNHRPGLADQHGIALSGDAPFSLAIMRHIAAVLLGRQPRHPAALPGAADIARIAAPERDGVWRVHFRPRG